MLVIEEMKMKKRILSLTAVLALALSALAVNIETDRTWYLAGETMTVRVTANDALIAYAELCDTHGLAAGTVVGLKGQTGTGIIELPSNLHSGYYVLSAYTRDQAEVSQRLVAVVNPLRKHVYDDIRWVELTHPDSLSYPETGGLSQWSMVNGQWSMLNGQCSMFNGQWSTFKVRETEGHIVKARVKNVYDGQTFRGSQICPSLSIIGQQIHYFEGKMIDDSTAVFYTYGISGKLPLVLSAMSSTGVSLPIEMVSPFATLLPKQLPQLVFHYQRSEVEARSINMQRYQLLKGDNGNLATGDSLDYEATLYGIQPDLSYNLDEYRQFLTIREVLLEYVECVKRTRVHDVPKLIVRRRQDIFNSSLPTLVLIDGMPVFDVDRLLNYDARRIHYINIYGDQYIFGNDIYNGILSFVTRSGRLTNYPTEPNMQYLVYDFP